MNTIKQIFLLFLILGVGLFFSACEDDPTDEPGPASGTLRVELTDSPVEDARVQGVFVTVAKVEVDGEPLAEFEGKQTIEISSYQNGDARFLGSDEVAAGTYNDVSLLLDLTSDESGSGPGCYVLTTDGTRHPLTIEGASSGMVRVGSGDFAVEDGQTTTAVIDFDLRKALRAEDNGADDQYDFVTTAELSAALRVVNKANTGAISGQVERGAIVDGEARIVAYAYTAGAYDRETETQPQGSGQLLFANAVASASVGNNGDYTVAFLNKGDYEVVFAAYEDENEDEQAEFAGTLEVGILGNITLNPGILSVDAQSSTTLSISVLSILP